MFLPRRFVIASALAGTILVSARAQNQPQHAIGEIFATDARVKGAVLLASSGMQVMSGSSVAAGQSAALLVLKRGGYVRICPHTNLAISSSRTGRDLMFGMGTGAVEADYKLEASADAILTPDFRILFAGPGTFHIAVAADARGNTCVRSLAHNSAAVIISELMGDGTYQVKPGDQVVFHNGKLSEADHAVSECGCAPPPPVMRAAATPPPPPPANPTPTAAPAAAVRAPESPETANLPTTPAPPMAAPVSQPLPPSLANEVHVQVDAPFVFSAKSEVGAAPLQQVARLSLSTTPEMALIPKPPEVVELRPPPAPPKPVAEKRHEPRKRGFFGKVGSFFASIFR